VTRDRRRPVLLYLLGERSRGDDSAAFLAASLLPASCASEVIEAGHLGPDSLVGLPPGTAVVVADAVLGVPPGEVVVLPLSAVATGSGPAPRSSHVMPLQQVLALTEVLGGLPDGSFIGIGAVSFDLGAPPSPTVRAALPSFARAIADEIERLGAATRAWHRDGI
jgi:hydrogenase maturation protease